MKVVVRVRPENKSELGTRVVVRVLNDKMLIFDPQEQIDDFFYQAVKQKQYDILNKPNKNLQFTFNHVFGGFSSNQEVYDEAVKCLLDGILNGYNCSVFAYGATGAGKTFTMAGSENNPGITFLTMMDLYNRIEEIESKVVDVAVTYLEVYNENICDLLNPCNNLPIRDDPQRGSVVSGLTFHKPKTAEELIDMLKKGNQNRTQHPTDANAESSRSHAVFTVYVKQKDCSDQTMPRMAKLSLIDLAGSERATVISANKGIRMREGANINKSLLALGNCINALADRKIKSYIPYRNSKLTRLLKDCLGGNCQTVMVAAVSPSSRNYEDTYNTLNYAKRAMCIRENLKQNIIGAESAVGHYAKIIQELQQEVMHLKAQLKECKTDQISQPPLKVTQDVIVPNVEGKHRLAALFAEIVSTQNDILLMTRQVRELEIKIHQRQRRLDDLCLVSINSAHLERSSFKTDSAILRMQKKHESVVARIREAEKKLIIIRQQLSNLENSDINLKNSFSEWTQMQHMDVEMKNQLHLVAHLKHVAISFNNEYNRITTLMSALMKTVKRQYLLLLGNGLVSSDVEEDYHKIVKLAEGYKEVAWADDASKDALSSTMNIETFLTLQGIESITGEVGVLHGGQTTISPSLKRPRDSIDNDDAMVASGLSPFNVNGSNDTFIISPTTDESKMNLHCGSITLTQAMQMDSPKPKRHCSESDSVNSSTTKTLVSKLSSTPSLHAEERILNKRYLLGNNVSGKEICAEKLVGQSQLSQSQPSFGNSSYSINADKDNLDDIGKSQTYKMKSQQKNDSKSHPYRGVENRIKKIASSSALANLPFIKKKQAPKSTEKSLTRSTSLSQLGNKSLPKKDVGKQRDWLF